MRGLNILLVLVVGIFMCGLGSAENLALTDNNSNGYYDIHNCTELQNISLDLTANYELMNDIDCSDTINWNSGAGFVPIGNGSGQFTGNFNGTGKVIFNLTINKSSSDYIGLFGYAGGGGSISNVGLTNVNFVGKDNVGGLAGTQSGSGTISNSYSTGNVTGSNFVGGLVGYQIAGTISNSYSTGNVTGSNSVGGFVGIVFGTISNSYSTGNVTGSNARGFIGSHVDGTISNSYWDMNTSGQIASDGGDGKTTIEMKNLSMYNESSWDFTSVWKQRGELDYPALLWENIVFTGFSPLVHLFPQLNSTATSRDFIYNVSDDSNIANCSLFIEDSNSVSYLSSNNTNLTAVNKSSNNTISFSPFAVGSYTAYVNCTDSYEFEGQSNIISFEIQAPAVVEEVTSSGSGSAGPTARSVSDSAFTNGFTGNFRTSDSLKFKVNNQTHNITVNNISNSSITITVQSIPQTFVMKAGDILNVDVNYDGVKDVEISYLKYYTSVVSLKVRAIALPYELPVVNNGTSLNCSSSGGSFCNDTEICSSDEVFYDSDVGKLCCVGKCLSEINEDNRWLYIGLSIVLFLFFVAIVVMIIYVLMKHNERRKIRALLDRNKRK